MKRVFLGTAVAAVLALAAVFARTNTAAPSPTADAPPPLQVAVEGKNPWTGLKVNDAPDQFQFAVVADRTGGQRANVFSRAVHQVNLLQPSFVMSVGDLIQGTTAADRQAAQWDQFDGFAKNFTMPFFYNPGNHDIGSKVAADVWAERYGRRYYHFTYKGVLFLCLCSENPHLNAVGAIDPDQREYVKKVLADVPASRWTFVFLHKPIWTAKDLEKNGWGEVEKLLAGRKYTVFCGHVHKYQKFVRNGANYYQLATTGGGSRLRGVEYGEFDHVAWVTVKKDAPVIANVLLDGLLPDDLTLPETDEPGGKKQLLATVPFGGTVTDGGKPVAGATVRFFELVKLTGKYAAVADGRTDAAGRFELTTYKKGDGCPVGKYAVTVTRVVIADGEEKNDLPERFAAPDATPLTATVSAMVDSVKLELTATK